MTDPNQHDDPLVRTSLNAIDFAEQAIAEGKITKGRDELDARENGIGNTARNQRIDRLLDTMTRHADTLVALSRHEPGARWRGRAIATAGDAIRAEVGFEP